MSVFQSYGHYRYTNTYNMNNNKKKKNKKKNRILDGKVERILKLLVFHSKL